MLGVPVRLRDAATLDDLVASHRVATRPSSGVRSIRDLRAAPGPCHTELMNRSLHPMIDDMTTTHTRRSTTTQGAVEFERRQGRRLREGLEG